VFFAGLPRAAQWNSVDDALAKQRHRAITGCMARDSFSIVVNFDQS
jgi:hypothetical protein